MSQGDGCAYAIGSSMLYEGDYRDERDYYSLPLRMGEALESMMVRWLADHGLSVFFAKRSDADNQQLEIAHQDPERRGHPDGLCAILDVTQCSRWLMEHMPSDAISDMLDGELYLLELKTMNPDSWREFVKHGLDANVSLFKKYRGQVNGYLGTLADPANDELWDSKEFRSLLKGYGYARPTKALIVGFNTGVKGPNKWAIRTYNYRPDAFAATRERLYRDVILPMRNGMMPAPTYGGTDPECFWCPVKKLCPARQDAELELLDLENIPVEVPNSPKLVEQLQEAAIRYKAITNEITALEAEKEAIRDQILSTIPAGSKVFLHTHTVSVYNVKGRRGIDYERLARYAEQFGFDIPYKSGEGGTRMRVTALNGGVDDGDED